ncbi:outer membrane protein assembly factor [Polaribacter sp.]|nr:outer membrane protein assembly factor [Polaribacter sp.]
MKKLSLYLLIITIFIACNSTEHVVDGQHMLTQNYIFRDSVKYKKGDLQKYILQKPNPRFLNLPFGLYLHNLGKHNAPETPSEWGALHLKSYNFIKNVFSEKQSIAYANSWINLNNRFLKYEEPVIVSDFKVNNTAANLEAYYKTQGYFKATVNAKINRFDDKKATVEYYISAGKPTTLDTVRMNIESPVLDSIYKNANLKSSLVSGSQYRDQNFRREAKKVVKLFRNNGIFNFSESAIGFYVDSTGLDYKTNVDYIIAKDRLVEKNDGTYENEPFTIHKIRKVSVHSDYTFDKKDVKYKDTVDYKGIRFLAHDKLKYKPKYLSQSIFQKPNSIYKDTLRRLTRSHLKSLKNFKATNIVYSKVSGEEDLLDMDVYLTPIDKYTLGIETELTHSNIREIGTSLKLSRTDRNLFKGAELFKISLLGSYFIAVNGPGYEIGADISLEIPRFVAPFGLNNIVPKRMSPRTLYSLGSSFQNNIGLDRQTFTFLSDYQWKFDSKKTIQIELFNTQYIQNLNIGRYFDIYNSEFITLNTIAMRYDAQFGTSFAQLSTNIDNQVSESLSFIDTAINNSSFSASNSDDYNDVLNIFDRYKIITSDFLIPTLAYSFTYNNQSTITDNNFSYFKMRLANSGNILGLLSDERNSDDKTTFLKIPLAQYFRTDFEYKKFWDTNSNAVFGVRAFVGAIFTYDNSDIPFTRSYFAGGSNDIRAWQTYELGPGSSDSGIEYNVGSFKFLTSAEYRFDVYGKLKGALFADAGNIWDITGSDFVSDEAKLSSLSSFQDIAVGTGVGARVDFDFLIIRLDLGFKTYEPYLSGNRWFQNYDLSSSVLNLGINYPF